MSRTRRVKVDTRGVNKQLEAYTKKVGIKAEEALSEIAEDAKDYAAELFANAEYDGENDVVVDVRKYKTGVYIVAYGKALPFIEYGTGLGRDNWYFADYGRDVQLNATGKEFKYRYVERRGKTPTRIEYRVIEEKVLNDWFRSGHTDDLFLGYKQHSAVKRDEQGNYIMHPRYGRIALSRVEVEGDYTGEKVTEKVKRTPVYNTEGNPPNDIMPQVREYIIEIAPEIIEQYVERIKQ